MSVLTDEERIREIQVRAEAAFEGPWISYRDGDTWNVRSASDAAVASVACARPGYTSPRDRADAIFIARSREDIPWLIDKVRAALAACAVKDAALESERKAKEAAELHLQSCYLLEKRAEQAEERVRLLADLLTYARAIFVNTASSVHGGFAGVIQDITAALARLDRVKAGKEGES